MTRTVALAVVLACALARANPPPGATAKIDRVVAIVSRHPIWSSQLDERRGGPATTIAADRQILDGLVDEELVAARGRELHIAVSKDEVDAAMTEIKQQNHLDDAGLDAALAAQHWTRDRYRVELERQIVRLRVIYLDVTAKIAISDDEIRRAYDEKKRADAKIAPLDKLREQLVTELRAKRQESELVPWLAKLRLKAHIEVRL